MDFKYKKWIVLFAAVIVTFAVLGGGQLLWQKFAVAKPLDTALLDINGVHKVVREGSGKKDDPVKINVTLNNVTNIQKTYTSILDGVNGIMAGKRAKIVISDSRSAELEQLDYMIQPHIQEAIVTGTFTQMVNRIQEQAAAKGVTAQVFIDSRYIYLQMTKDGAELYDIVPRHPDTVEVR